MRMHCCLNWSIFSRRGADFVSLASHIMLLLAITSPIDEIMMKRYLLYSYEYIYDGGYKIIYLGGGGVRYIYIYDCTLEGS